MTDFRARALRRARLCLLIAAAWCWLLGLVGAPPPAAARSAGDWVWPLDPRPAVARGFDPPSRPWLAGHRGVDLVGRAGQRVLSAGSGEVTFGGRLAGTGIVVVRSGDVRTTYQPVRATVAVGDVVASGDEIGRLEELGGHCLPVSCLHWGLLRGHAYLDPLQLVGAGPPRLLPLFDRGRAATALAPPVADVLADGATPAGATALPSRGGRALAVGVAAGVGLSLLLASGTRRRGRARPPPT